MECDRRLSGLMGGDGAHILLPPMATPSVVLDSHTVDHFAAQRGNLVQFTQSLVHGQQHMASSQSQSHSNKERASGGGAHCSSSEQVEGAQQRQRMLSQATSNSRAHCIPPVGSNLGSSGVVANGLSGVYHTAASSQRAGLSTGATAHQVCPLTSLQQWHRARCRDACNEPPADLSTPLCSALRAAVLILATGMLADAGDTQLPGATVSARAAAAQRHAVAGPSRAAAGHEQRGWHCERGGERASLLPNLARSHCARFVPAVFYLPTLLCLAPACQPTVVRASPANMRLCSLSVPCGRRCAVSMASSALSGVELVMCSAGR